MAALAGKSIKQFTLERLFPTDTEDPAMQELKALLAERVDEAHRGEFAQGSISALAEKSVQTQTGK